MVKKVGGYFHLEVTQAVDPDDPNFRKIDDVQVIIRFCPWDEIRPFSVGARISDHDSFYCMHYRETLGDALDKKRELLNERRKALGWREL